MRPKFYAALKLVSVAAALVFLSACENPYIQQFKEEFGWTEARMVSDGWLKGRDIPVEPTYCYETLGDADCFRAPKKSEQTRAISHPDPSGF